MPATSILKKYIPIEQGDLQVLAPFSGEEIATLRQLSAQQVNEEFEKKLELARRIRAGDPCDIGTIASRSAALQRAAETILQQKQGLADLIAWEGGKPLKDSIVEVERAAQTLRLCAEEAARLHGEQIPLQGTAAGQGKLAFTWYRPLMPQLAISAFNHPLNLIAHQMGPALALGAPLLVKPALETPLSALVLERIVKDAGIPADLVSVLICGHEAAEQMVRRRELEFLSFIGSAKVGWYLRSLVAPGVRVALEHGGTAPLIVTDTADLEGLLPKLLKGRYYHSGQVCVSTQNVYAHRSLLEPILDVLKPAVERLKTGDPRHSETDCGPLIRKRDLERIEKWVGEAIEHGATLLTGGKTMGRQSFSPTVLLNSPAEMSVVREEVFGPVLNVIAIESLDDAIERINLIPWRFQASIWTQDINEALRGARRLLAKHCLINESTAFRLDSMPFGGAGPSGLGTGGIYHSMREMSDECMVTFSSPDWHL